LNGNQQAQEIFYNKFRKIIKDFIRSKYSLYYDLEDDVSEILIKAYYSLNTFDPDKSKLKSWVCNIAKNYMIDKWRSNPVITYTSSNNYAFSTGLVTNASSGQIFTVSNGTSVDFSCDSVITTTSSNSNSYTVSANSSFTSCNAVDFENCNTVNYISSQISPTDFSLLNMKYMQGYSHCEIGKEFQLTSGTVSNRINYIKTKLKKDNKEEILE